MTSSKVTIYVLKLQENKWYIGRTSDSNRRLNEHFTGNGSEWTKRYPPVEVFLENSDCDIYDEDKYTKVFMARYGIDNVRGGSYVTYQLSSEQKNNITREIRNAKDLCLLCGSTSHFVSHCPNRHRSATSIDETNKKKVLCSRCGRNNHLTEDCYAKHHRDGHLITSAKNTAPSFGTSHKSIKKKENEGHCTIL